MSTTSPVDAAFARVLRPGTSAPSTVTPFARRAAVYAYASLPDDQQVGADPSITAGAYAEHLRDHPATSVFRTFEVQP